MLRSDFECGFDFVEYLKKHWLVGQLDPWRRTDDGKPLFALLVPVDTALAECKEWSKIEISRAEFIDYLKLNDVLTFRNVDEFVKIKESKKKVDETPLKLKKRQLSEDHKEKLRNNIKKARTANPNVIG